MPPVKVSETERTLKEAQGTVKSSTKAVENKAQSWEKEAETKGKATLNKVEKKGEELKKEISKDVRLPFSPLTSLRPLTVGRRRRSFRRRARNGRRTPARRRRSTPPRRVGSSASPTSPSSLPWESSRTRTGTSPSGIARRFCSSVSDFSGCSVRKGKWETGLEMAAADVGA